MAKSTDNSATRNRRSPAEIAQAELDKATTRHEKAQQRLQEARDSIHALENEVTRAARFLDFAKTHPDLPSDATAPDEPAV